jgi:hypothetical protein
MTQPDANGAGAWTGLDCGEARSVWTKGDAGFRTLSGCVSPCPGGRRPVRRSSKSEGRSGKPPLYRQ